MIKIFIVISMTDNINRTLAVAYIVKHRKMAMLAALQVMMSLTIIMQSSFVPQQPLVVILNHSTNNPKTAMTTVYKFIPLLYHYCHPSSYTFSLLGSSCTFSLLGVFPTFIICIIYSAQLILASVPFSGEWAFLFILNLIHTSFTCGIVLQP